MSKTRNIKHAFISSNQFRLMVDDAAKIAQLSVGLRPGKLTGYGGKNNFWRVELLWSIRI